MSEHGVRREEIHALRRRGAALLSAAALAMGATLAACSGGGEGPTGTSGATVLDTASIAASANKLGAVAAQPVLLAIAEQGSLGGSLVFDRGVARIPRVIPQGIASAARLVPGARIAPPAGADVAPRVARATTPAVIPDSLLGKTLVLNSLGEFVIGTAAVGAPSNGVRFIILAPGTNQNLGYADLTESISGAADNLTLDVVPTSGPAVLHDVETLTSSGADTSDAFVGYATNGTDRVDYAGSEQTVGSRTTVVSTVSAPTAGVALTDTSIVAGATANDVDVAQLTIGTSTLRFTTVMVANGTAGGYAASNTTNVTANGAPFARIVSSSSGAPAVTGPNGGSLSSGDQAALAGVDEVLYAAETILATPITIEYWLSLAAAGL